MERLFGCIKQLRRTLRTLARQPGMTTAALLSLALGIGANVALFSVADGVLLRPLPYPEEERLVHLWEEHEGAQAMVRAPLLSNLTYDAWDGSSATLESLGAYSRDRFLERTDGGRFYLEGASLSPVIFSMLGARPALGRLFTEADGSPGATPVTVLSHGFWQQRFGGDPSVLGRLFEIDGESHTIVGVAHRGFYFPDREALLWIPDSVPPPSTDPERSSIHVFTALGKLRPGADAAQAAAEGTARARATERPPVAQAIFGSGGEVVVKARQLRREMTERVRPALLLLAAGVALILLICCANVANLLLSRGVSRRRELAVKSALGASRRHLLGQVLAETLTLGLGGGLLGIGLGAALLQALPALAPADFPRLEEVQLDGRALAFALAVTLGTALAAGLLPLFQTFRISLLGALGREPSRGTGSRAFPFGRGLLVAEAALAVLLLVAAGLLLHSFSRLLEVDAGFDHDGVVAARILLPEGTPPQVLYAQATEMLEALRGTDGVVAAGAGNMAPLSSATAISQFTLPWPGPDGEPLLARAISYVITPGYPEALSMRLLEGRWLEDSDRASGTRTVLVNEAFVRSYLADGPAPVGRRLMEPSEERPEPAEIVGVVADVLRDGLDDRPQAAIYWLPGPEPRALRNFSLLVRTTRDPGPLAGVLREVAKRVEPLAAVDVATLESQVHATLAQPRFAAATLGAFALLALVLAATGLYGVLSYSVARRTREMGIRSALGADRGALVRLVLRQGLGVTALGLLLGLAAAAALTRWLESQLFGVSPLDPLTFLAAPSLLLLVAAGACLLPARRAASTEPGEALRSE